MDTALPHKVQGMLPDELDKLADRCRTYLLGIARERRSSTYKDVMEFLGVDRFKIPLILGTVSRREKAAGRPALSALVLYVDKAEPGPGFAAMAKEEGWLPAEARDDEAYIFWLRELHGSWVRWA